MPVQIRCQCGKALKIPDNLAGKAVKCPGCGKTLKVPAAGGAPKPAQAAPRPAPPQPTAAVSGGLDDLFDEEGFSSSVEALCPVCRAEMASAAVLCTKCGYHKESGEQFASHKTAGVDIDHGTIALEKAADDMVKAKELQAKLIAGGGMPWWALALVLFMIGSALTIAVLTVNASRRVDEDFRFNGLALFFVLADSAFACVSQGAFIMIVVHAFKQSVGKGLLTLFVPFYALYHIAKNWSETWKYFAASVVLGGIAGGLFAAAQAQGGI